MITYTKVIYYGHQIKPGKKICMINLENLVLARDKN